MSKNQVTRLHWKLFFPLVGILWIVIAVTIIYFVNQERQRLSFNLGNRLRNVNSTIEDAHDKGLDLEETVSFIKLFTDQTTLDPLLISVYDSQGNILAGDRTGLTRLLNMSTTDSANHITPAMNGETVFLKDVSNNGVKYMVSASSSSDGTIHTFAALPYKGEVKEYMRIDPMLWVVILSLGLISSILAFFSAKAICRNIYSLHNFAEMIASNNIPDDVDSWHFSKDELGDVSKRLLTLYREKLKAEREKTNHERQIGVNVSHELNTPVAIIKGYLDTILNDGSIPEEQKQSFLIRARENTDRLAELIEDLNKVMRLQENMEAISTTDIDFKEFISGVIDDARHEHAEFGMSVKIDVPHGCRVIGNGNLLSNALLNLIKNSIQHSSGTEIAIRWIKDEEGMSWFSFSDNGKGVEAEHLDRLFDLFYRVDNGRSRKNGGSGLGLPMVARIFSALNGSISVRNNDEGGLEFIFSLPKNEAFNSQNSDE